MWLNVCNEMLINLNNAFGIDTPITKTKDNMYKLTVNVYSIEGKIKHSVFSAESKDEKALREAGDKICKQITDAIRNKLQLFEVIDGMQID